VCSLGGEGYLKCVWDRRRHLGPDLNISKEAKAYVRRCLVKFMRAVLRVRGIKSSLREKDWGGERNVVPLLQDGLAQRRIERDRAAPIICRRCVFLVERRAARGRAGERRRRRTRGHRR
jgi:hypothetical protein